MGNKPAFGETTQQAYRRHAKIVLVNMLGVVPTNINLNRRPIKGTAQWAFGKSSMQGKIDFPTHLFVALRKGSDVWALHTIRCAKAESMAILARLPRIAGHFSAKI